MHLSDTTRACCVCRRPTRRLVNGWPVCTRCRVRPVVVVPLRARLRLSLARLRQWARRLDPLDVAAAGLFACALWTWLAWVRL